MNKKRVIAVVVAILTTLFGLYAVRHTATPAPVRLGAWPSTGTPGTLVPPAPIDAGVVLTATGNAGTPMAWELGSGISFPYPADSGVDGASGGFLVVDDAGFAHMIPWQPTYTIQVDDAGFAHAVPFPSSGGGSARAYFQGGTDGALDCTSSSCVCSIPCTTGSGGSSITLTRNVSFTNFTVDTGVTLHAAGFGIQTTGTLTVTGIIDDSGLSAAFGVPGNGAPWNWYGGGSNGGTGNGVTFGGGNVGLGGTGGTGGAAGAGTGGVTNGSIFTTLAAIPEASLLIGNLNFNGVSATGAVVPVVFGGGSGGGGGGAGSSGVPGAGGGGGGYILISAFALAGGGTIQANGGAGGNATLTAGPGGGGGGGTIVIIEETNTFSGSITVTGGAAGTGGAGGASAGGDGKKIIIPG